MGMMRMVGGMGEPLDGPTTVLWLEPQARSAASKATIPDRLVETERLDPSRAVRRRELRLTMGMGGMMGRRGMMSGMGPGMGRGMMGGGTGWFGIDGRPFDMSRVDQTVSLDDTEIWEVSADMMVHPFHMHGVHFGILSRGGSPATMDDRGPRDTVLVREPVEILVHFTKPAASVPFTFHCHTLEHEDAGMMGHYKTSDQAIKL